MRVSRRFFLQSSGALAAYAGVAPLRTLAAAAQQAPGVTAGKTLVVIFLRGGIDGLNWIVPHADPGYPELRRSLELNKPGRDQGVHDLDGFFGLHPRASALMPWFNDGLAVAAHAVGYDKNTRSHFEEQDTWETGVVGNTLGSDGWLNRHLATSTGHGPVRAIALGDTLPRILRGDAPAYAVRGLEDLGLPSLGKDDAVVAAALEHAYTCDPRTTDPSHIMAGAASVIDAGALNSETADAADLVQQTGADTLEGIKLIRSVTDKPYKPAAEYANNSFASRLAAAARLIKAEIGVEVIEIDYGGWDTHNNQGNGIYGPYGDKQQVLAEGLAAFARDLGDKLGDTLVLTLSDFGRTARENGTRGTDHGWANAMLALGGPVANTGEKVGGADGQNRRKVVTDWPGVLPDQLHQNRDLRHTTDFRDVLAEVVGVHLGNENLKKIIPRHEHKPVGLVATA